jgi:CHAD domain-containing protein
MSVRIHKHSALLANGFRKTMQEQLTCAIKELDISARTPRAARLHSSRQRMKKARSALRLLHAASFSNAGQTDLDLLRDATAEISAPRNADANIQALTKLCNHSDSDHLRFSEAFALLKKQKNAAAMETTASMHKAVTLLKGALSRIESWDDGSIAWKEVRRGLKHIYKRGRATYRKAADDITSENLHGWRKRTKDIFYSLKLMQSTYPEAILPLAKNAKKLGALLGADHDLALLQTTLQQHGIKKEKTALDKLIAVRRRKLQCKAFKLGAKLYSRKPGAFVEKLDC